MELPSHLPPGWQGDEEAVGEGVCVCENQEQEAVARGVLDA